MSIYARFMIIILCAASAVPAFADYNEGKLAMERKDYAAAYAELLPVAEQGHHTAQYLLAQLYENGWGTARDSAQAARWFRQATEGMFKIYQQQQLEIQAIKRDSKELLEEIRHLNDILARIRSETGGGGWRLPHVK